MTKYTLFVDTNCGMVDDTQTGGETDLHSWLLTYVGHENYRIKSEWHHFNERSIVHRHIGWTIIFDKEQDMIACKLRWT